MCDTQQQGYLSRIFLSLYNVKIHITIVSNKQKTANKKKKRLYLVFLQQISERIRGFVMFDVRVSAFTPDTQVVCNRLASPSSPHVVISTPRLAHPHQTLLVGLMLVGDGW
jgi:hypothetical protein